jgi:hypothetical protein
MTSTTKPRTTRLAAPEWLRHDDNVGNVYGVFTPTGFAGYVHYVPSSRSWVAALRDGSTPGDIIDATTLGYAAQLLADHHAQVEEAARLRDDADEREALAAQERREAGTVKHADIAAAGFVGTIDQQQMARLVRMLGTYIADGVEQPVRIHIRPSYSGGTVLGTPDGGLVAQITIGGGVSGADLYITDSAVDIKGA